MDLIEAQNQLALLLYDWSKRDLLREMNEGCPLISLVGLNNRYVLGFASWVRTMSATEREILANLLARYAHENAARLRGEALSEQEEKRFRKEFFPEVSLRE